MTIYAYAEAEGESLKKEFKVNQRDGAGQKIDSEKPATIRKPVNLGSTDKVFTAVAKAKEAGFLFRNVVVVVGSGANNISTSFGADVDVHADAVEAVAKLGRTQLGDEMADVKMTWRAASVERAGEIDAFITAIGETVSAAEIEQQ